MDIIASEACFNFAGSGATEPNPNKPGLPIAVSAFSKSAERDFCCAGVRSPDIAVKKARAIANSDFDSSLSLPEVFSSLLAPLSRRWIWSIYARRSAAFAAGGS